MPSRRERRLAERMRGKEARHRKGHLNKYLLAAGGILASGLIGGGTIWYYSNRTPELNLQNTQRSENVEFVQSYLGQILSAGKVTFESTEVVYDPEGRKNIEFWENYLLENPDEQDFVRQQIDGVRSNLDDLEMLHKGTSAIPSGVVAFASTAVDKSKEVPSKEVFVYEIPKIAITDDDILWFLDHERCHAETNPQHTVTISGEFDPDEARKTVEATFGIRDVEEARCYTYQFQQEKRFNVNRIVYNAALSAYRDVYDRLLKESKSGDIKGLLLRELLNKVFIDPYQLQPR